MDVHLPLWTIYNIARKSGGLKLNRKSKTSKTKDELWL